MRRITDRRGRPRFEIVGDLWGSVELAARLEVVNVGRGGALLAAPFALPADSVQTMTMTTEDGEQHVLGALVRHVRPAGARRFLVGVEFLDVPPALGAALDRHVADGTVDRVVKA